MKIKDIVSIIFFSLFLNAPLALAQNAAILPQGKTQFLDNNANPLSAGKVYFYIPSTTTFKTTWQDAGKTIPNTNPVTLDAGGRAIIYGDGTYRQRVFDRNANLIFDAVTASAGTGGGTTGTGDGDLVGTVKPWAGLIAPNQYVFAYGQEISRATYPALLTAITLNQNITCTSASPTLTGLSDTSQIPVGAVLEATCIAAGSTVVSKTTTTVTMNNNASLTTATTGIFFLYGNGNGSTTFNVPDLRGYVIAGRCNMGGVSCTLTTANYLGNPNATGAKGGIPAISLDFTQVPPYTPSGTVTGVIATGTVSTPTITVSGGTHGGTGAGVVTLGGGTTIPINDAGIAATSSTPVFTGTGGTATFNGNPGPGTAAPFSNIPPEITLNYIIKITPDQNSADASGVTSLGLMTGDISCGTGLLCTGNIISISGSFSGSWVPSGTGGTVRTISSSLQERGVTPTDYGAIPNSSGASAVNNAAFVNAFNASSSVYCKTSDTFYITTFIVPSTARSLRDCNFITVAAATAVSAIDATGGNNLAISNITLDLTASLAGSNGILIRRSNGVTLSNSRIVGGSIGILVYDNAYDTRVLDNTISGGYGRAIYASPFVQSSNPLQTVTISNASPAVVTFSGTHGLSAGDNVIFYTTGGLPAPIVTGDLYYVLASGLSTSQFQFSRTPGGAAINTSTAGSGTVIVTGANVAELLISGNTIKHSTRAGGSQQGIALQAPTRYRIVNNQANIDVPTVGPTDGNSFSIETSLGSYGVMDGNTVQNSTREAMHTDSSVNVVISNNVLKFNSNSLDYGISVSSDNGPPARGTKVIGNIVEGSAGPGIGFVGIDGCSAYGNTLRNTNFLFGQSSSGPGPAAIAIDGTAAGSVNCTIGQNTIFDPNGNVQYQVAEGKFSNPAAPQPNNNQFSQQLGDKGTLGYLSKTGPASTSIIRAASSVSSNDATTGINFEDASFAKRDTGSGNHYFYNYDSTLVMGLGSASNQLMQFGQTSFKWFSLGFGSQYASLDGNGWGWTNVVAGGTPSAGTSRVYVDSTTKALTSLDDAGILHTTVIANTGASNNFLTAISAAGVISRAQPAFSNLSGQITLAQLPTLATNTILGNATSGSAVPTALAIGSCSSASSALIWTTNTGFGCNTSITATNATNSAITNDTTTNATMFPAWVTANTGNLPLKVTSTKLTFNPSTGVLSSTSFTGAGTGLTGTAASLTVGNVTTNANLTGPITSVGNATSIASQTGTGTKFVVDTSPTLVTPILGAASASNIAFNVSPSFVNGPSIGNGSNTLLLVAGTSGLQLNNQGNTQALFNLSNVGHLSFQSPTPVVSACGTTPAITGSDVSGTVTMGTGAPVSCTITFANAYGAAPHCTVTWRATPLLVQSYTVSTANITLTQTATSSNLIDYTCSN